MLAEAEVREAWGRLGLAATGSTPTQLRAALRAEHDFWRPVVKAATG